MATSTGLKRLMVVGGVVVIAAAVSFHFFHNGSESRAADAQGRSADGAGNAAAVPVTVADVVQQTVPMRLSAIGNVEPYSSVAVKARVDGEIVEVDFTDGQEVRQGSTLFRIDPRPYQAALAQAEAAAARDEASLNQARSQERRYQELLDKNFVSKEAYAQFRTNAETAAAVALASKAAVESARLNLGYATIRSPIDGYPGKVMIQRGNLIKAGDASPLVLLNQVHPIYVNFAVPEQQLAAIRASMKDSTLPVTATVAPASGTAAAVAPASVVPGGGAAPTVPAGAAAPPTASGALVFVDNAVDPATGTIRLRARFDNHDNALWPGQFVNVTVTLREDRDQIEVPAQSVQTGPNGNYVFVVKPDMTADVRPVTVGRTDGNNAIIASGVTKGERIVTEGQLRLAKGTKVSLKSADVKTSS